MSKKYLKIIKKWAKLRHPDAQFEKAALYLYENSIKRDQVLMLKEFQDYIDGVKNNEIIPSVPKIPIRIFKKT